MDRLFFLTARVLFFLTVVLFLSILAYLFFEAVEAYMADSSIDGLYPALSGSVSLVLLSVLFAFPLGVATAIYAELYAGALFARVVDISFSILAATPSIVIGLFGFSTLLLLHRYFPELRGSLLCASVTLSVLILPYIVKSVQRGLRETPGEYISMAYALGASKEDILVRVMLPHAVGHIKRGVFLAIARSAEDTAVIMLTGAVASYGFVDALLSPFEALPFHIYYMSASYADESELGAIYISAIMLIALSSLFIYLSGALSERAKGRVWSV